MDREATSVMAQFRQRARAVLQAEGLAGLARRGLARLGRRPAHHRSYILMTVLKDATPQPPPSIPVDIAAVRANDDADLDELAAVEEWQARKADLLERLAEGRECYVAKHEGRIVAGVWCREGRFYDGYLARHFQLAEEEIYYQAAFTVPLYRGQGIMPYLMTQMTRAIVARNPRKTRGVGFIQVTNRPSLRSMEKGKILPARLVSHVELFGLRFHYL